MAYSSFGKKLSAAYAVMFFINILTLALSARVNEFQEYFFVADLFPLALSIITFVSLFFMMLFDFGSKNAFTARAPFTIGWFSILSIFWLAFNSFSTSRWRHVPLNCSAIPAGYNAEKSWCRDLQALKSFVWIEWVVLVLITITIARFSVRQSGKGFKHIWTMPLSRYTQSAYINDSGFNYGSNYNAGNASFAGNEDFGAEIKTAPEIRSSEFLQYETKPEYDLGGGVPTSQTYANAETTGYNVNMGYGGQAGYNANHNVAPSMYNY